MADVTRKKIPLSGDRFADWYFRGLLRVLDGEVLSVRRAKNIRDPQNPHTRMLHGLLTPDNEIYLNVQKHKKTKSSFVSTLIHETCHLIHPNETERYIRQLEKILWIRFTDAQKRYLKAYIGRRIVDDIIVAPSSQNE